MGSILDKIDDDMDEYLDACAALNIQPRYSQDYYGIWLLDCYSRHAEWAINKWRGKKVGPMPRKTKKQR